MDRVLQATPATASATFYQDGVVADPGSVTVTVTREDGTSLTTGAASGSGATARTFNLSAANTAALDMLAIAWVSGTLGTITTYVEVVGGFLISLSSLRTVAPLSNATIYPTSTLIAARIAAETALEDACSVAFVPRYARELLDGPPGGSTDVLLDDHPRPLSITSATDTGLTVDPTTLLLYDDGRVYNPAGWTEGRRNIVLKLTHGYKITPARVSAAVGKLVKRILVDSPVNDRATSMTTQDGTVEFFVTAGVRQAVFDVPECNAVIEQYGLGFGVG